MKKVFTFVAVSALAFALSSIASADNNIPGAYAQDNNAQVMGVGQTIMQMGAYERGLTNAANLASRAGQFSSGIWGKCRLSVRFFSDRAILETMENSRRCRSGSRIGGW